MQFENDYAKLGSVEVNETKTTKINKGISEKEMTEVKVNEEYDYEVVYLSKR